MASLGLRERKKRQTREAIEQHALRLFAEQGFAATTIPQIAEAADVSPRTVSSYFPVKEDLVFSDSAEIMVQLRAHVAGREPGTSTAESLRSWIVLDHPRMNEKHADGAVRRQIIEADPGLQAYARQFLTAAELFLAEQLAADLGCEPDALEARMAAAATLAVLQAIEAHRDEQQQAGPTCSVDESLADALALLDRALLFITGGVEALRAG